MLEDNKDLIEKLVFKKVRRKMFRPQDKRTKSAEDFLRECAFVIASKICPGNEQFVVERISDGDYIIIHGWPADTTRHAIWSVGSLSNPRKKEAMLEAITARKAVIIEDALNDSRVDYMKEHIVNKEIRSLAILPIFFNEQGWLIIIDKVKPTKAGFLQEEIDYLEKCMKEISEILKEELSGNALADQHRVQLNLLTCMMDLVRPPLDSLLIALKRMMNFMDDNKANTRKHKTIIEENAKRLERDLRLVMELALHLVGESEPEPLKINELLDFFRNDKDFVLCFERIQNYSILTLKELILLVFEQLRNYIKINGKGKRTIKVAKTEDELIFDIESHGFYPNKIILDIKLFLIKELIEKLQGDLEILDKKCVITLPLAIIFD